MVQLDGDPTPPDDPLEAARHRAAAVLARLAGASPQAQAGHAESADRLIGMSVTPDGHILALALHPAALRQGPTSLAAGLIETHTSALQEARSALRTHVAELGVHPAVLDAVQPGEVSPRRLLESLGLLELVEPAERLLGTRVVQ